MFEYGSRVLLAGVLVFVSRMLGAPFFDVAWKLALAETLITIGAERLEASGRLNEGLAGFFAIGESAIVAILVASLGRLEQFGFLVLLPILIAARRKNANPIFMAPLGAGTVLVAWSLTSARGALPPALFLQIAAIMGLGLVIPRPEEKIIEVEAAPDEESLELRERIRMMRDSYQDLELKNQRANLLAELEEARGGGDDFYERLSGLLRRILGVSSIGLYALADFDDVMVVRGVAGDFGIFLQDSSIAVTLRQAQAAIASRTLQALRSLRGNDDRAITNVLLTDKGRLVGMIALADDNGLTIEEARIKLEPISGVLAQWFKEYQRREAWKRRTRQAEVLYDLASLGSGAATPEALCARVMREIWEIVDCDHVAVWRVQDDKADTVCFHGSLYRLLDSMSFAQGTGLPGWLRTGAPELALFDTRSDERCPSEESLRQRVGSFFCIPVLVDGRVFGFITVSTHRSGGLDVPDLETLRMVSAEFARALAQMDPLRKPTSEGIMTAQEFRLFVQKHAGTLVLLEPIKRNSLLEHYGRPAMNHAYRQFATRIRAKLPTGGALCRKGEGGLVVFLPDANEEFASEWANDAAATASMIGLTTPDGSARIPLPMRAKVAQTTPQKSGFLDSKAV
jgi:GGDEF domain-containing protein